MGGGGGRVEPTDFHCYIELLMKVAVTMSRAGPNKDCGCRLLRSIPAFFNGNSADAPVPAVPAADVQAAASSNNTDCPVILCKVGFVSPWRPPTLPPQGWQRAFLFLSGCFVLDEYVEVMREVGYKVWVTLEAVLPSETLMKWLQHCEQTTCSMQWSWLLDSKPR